MLDYLDSRHIGLLDSRHFYFSTASASVILLLCHDSRADFSGFSTSIGSRMAFDMSFTLWPNTSLEPTPVTLVSFRCRFWVGGSRRSRGSVLGR